MAERGPVMLQAATAFGALKGTMAQSQAGLWACERQQQMATVMAYHGRRAELAARLQAGYGLALPDGPCRTSSPGVAMIGLGPRTWLFTRAAGVPIAPELAEVVGDTAAVTDQSDGYAMLRLSGPRLREVLAKGVSIDLHDEVFVPGSAAATSCAHLGVILWRLEDADGHPVFELAVFRSFAHSLWHFIEVSAAEYGLAVPAEL